MNYVSVSVSLIVFILLTHAYSLFHTSLLGFPIQLTQTIDSKWPNYLHVWWPAFVLPAKDKLRTRELRTDQTSQGVLERRWILNLTRKPSARNFAPRYFLPKTRLNMNQNKNNQIIRIIIYVYLRLCKIFLHHLKFWHISDVSNNKRTVWKLSLTNWKLTFYMLQPGDSWCVLLWEFVLFICKLRPWKSNSKANKCFKRTICAYLSLKHIPYSCLLPFCLSGF